MMPFSFVKVDEQSISIKTNIMKYFLNVWNKKKKHGSFPKGFFHILFQKRKTSNCLLVHQKMIFFYE